MGKKVLEVKDLVTTFRIGKKEYEVLRGVSFDIEENETLCMVGESGCGKSVTTLSIMDLLPNNGRVVSGSIKLNGQELTTLSPKERNALRGKQMGMIFQEPMTALNPLLTIGRQMTEGLRLHLGMSREEAYETAVSYLEKVGIANPGDRMKQYPFQLSGGLRHARVICHFIDSEEYGLYHVVCPGSCSRYEFARTILEYTGKTGDLDLYPVVARDDVRPTYSVLDNMMLRLTGIPEPLDWKTALKEYLEETGGIE